MLHDEIKRTKPFDIPEEEAYLNVRRTENLLALGFERLFKRTAFPSRNTTSCASSAAPAGTGCRAWRLAAG